MIAFAREKLDDLCWVKVSLQIRPKSDLDDFVAKRKVAKAAGLWKYFCKLANEARMMKFSTHRLTFVSYVCKLANEAPMTNFTTNSLTFASDVCKLANEARMTNFSTPDLHLLATFANEAPVTNFTTH